MESQIISFLGAIHWGMEYAGYGGYHSYRRYMIGVIAPAVAWPTIFMPVEYALITAAVGLALISVVNNLATGIASLYSSITTDLASIGAQQQ